MTMFTVYIDDDPAALDIGATAADLEQYALNLADHLADRFDCVIEVQRVLGGGPRGRCPENEDIAEYVRELEAGDGWLDLLGSDPVAPARALPRSAGTCVCTPGVPKPDPDERPEDVVDVEGLDEAEAALILRAASAALHAGIEPGIRRARWINGWLAGVRAGRAEPPRALRDPDDPDDDDPDGMPQKLLRWACGALVTHWKG